MLGQVGMMGAVIWQQLQSHTGCVKLLSHTRVLHNLWPSSSRSPHKNDVLSYRAPRAMKDTVLIALSLLYFVIERYIR